MEMLPPTIKDEIGSEMRDQEVAPQCEAASFGRGPGNRLPVRRRLFADESVENSPPAISLTSMMTDLYESEKQRALRQWGFDITSDTPSTSSDFTYSVVKSSDAPAFYSKNSGPQNVTDWSRISLLPVLLPQSVMPSEKPSSGITSVTADVISVTSAKDIGVTPLKPMGKKAKSSNSESTGQKLITNYYPKKRAAAINPTEKKRRAQVGGRNGVQAESRI